jgi:hypothetical protein
MALLQFKTLPWRPERTAGLPPAENLSFLLAESVAAILLPHLRAALLSYAVRDRPRVLAAYAIGCSVLADLLSQEIAMTGWKDAGVEAMKRLVAACELDETPSGDAALEAIAGSAWLKRHFEGAAPYLEVCQMFEAAIGEVRQSRMSAKGSITARAAMARLEGLVLSVAAFDGLAA